MGYVKVDLDNLKTLKLNNEQFKLFLNQISKIELILRDFDMNVDKNPHLCPVCDLRKYVKLALDWQKVLRCVETLKNHMGDVKLPMEEFLLCSYYTLAADLESSILIEFGNEEIACKGIKDKNIDVLRVYGMMMNLFMKESLKKVLDNYTKLMYYMKVKPEQVYLLMNILLESIMTLVGRFVHIYDEKTHTGVIHIFKTREHKGEGLSCGEPLTLEYTVDKKGTTHG